MVILSSIEAFGKKILQCSEEPQISTWGIYDEVTIEAPVYIGRA